MVITWDARASAAGRYEIVLGEDSLQVSAAAELLRALTHNPVDVVILGPDVDVSALEQVASAIRQDHPLVSLVLVRYRMDVPTLTTALRAGVREVVADGDDATLVEAVRRVRQVAAQLAPSSGQKKDGKVITVFSPKGGVGKTVVSVNMSLYLAARGKRVLLIDLDLSFGDVALTMHLSPRNTIADLVSLSGNLDKAGLAKATTTHPSGVAVVAAPMQLDDAESVSPALVSEIISVARQEYDFIVIDTPPMFTDQALAAMDVTDKLALVATLDIGALKGIRVAAQTLDMLQVATASRALVVNRSNPRSGLKVADVSSSLGAPVAAEIPEDPVVAPAVNDGSPVILSAPRSPSAAALRFLVDSQVLNAFDPGAVVSEPDKNGRRGRRK